ncbi:hypothetical protein JD844_027034 [Phrynosoma platyrhinos]|uniref:PXA domain-containing protein n=1 Tax=Phrynosoma platyrhinos TaxID=52577 RepID=A0ABQ7SFQ1_PHRPL|nr:hypothetical protein JD844_027034 [Phrynosoma platyrhinos]
MSADPANNNPSGGGGISGQQQQQLDSGFGSGAQSPGSGCDSRARSLPEGDGEEDEEEDEEDKARAGGWSRSMLLGLLLAVAVAVAVPVLGLGLGREQAEAEEAGEEEEEERESLWGPPALLLPQSALRTVNVMHDRGTFVYEFFIQLPPQIGNVLNLLPGNTHEPVQSRRVVISHNMDKALKEVFDYSYRDYILSWYGHLSRDKGQLYHLLSEDFWEVAKQLRQRLSHIDVVKVVCNDVVKALFTHFCDLKAASFRFNSFADKSTALQISPQIWYDTGCRMEEQPRPFLLHPCLKNSNEEDRFLQACSQILVYCLLPSKDARSLSLRIVLAEILASKVLKPMVELLSDPNYINQMLLAQMEYREQVNEHHKRAYTYAPSYEEFIKLINSNSDVEFLKQLRYQIVVEIVQATTISSFPQMKRQKGRRECKAIF